MDSYSRTNVNWFLRDEREWDSELCYLEQCDGGFCEGLCTSEKWRTCATFRSLERKYRELKESGRLLELCETKNCSQQGFYIQIMDPPPFGANSHRDLFSDDFEAFDNNPERLSNVCCWCIDRVARGTDHAQDLLPPPPSRTGFMTETVEAPKDSSGGKPNVCSKCIDRVARGMEGLTSLCPSPMKQSMASAGGSPCPVS